MSRLLILTRPDLVLGFQLAGVEAYGAPDVETAEELVEMWLRRQERGLVAIDDGLLSHMDPSLLRRLDTSEYLAYLAIPGGKSLGPEVSRRHRITAMIRQAIGVHITFRGEGMEEES